jgi:hypothetical protein
VSKADWAGASVPVMWTSAQAADTGMAWQQVTAWQRTHDLLLHHEDRLRKCRDELTLAWPPSRSPAATAFVEYIDGLLKSIGRAKNEAVENHKALTGILTSLSATKADMAKLKAEWDRRETEDANMARNLPNDLFASGDNWRDSLNEKGRARMAQNDQEILEATRKMVQLTPAQAALIEGGDQFDPKEPVPARSPSGGDAALSTPQSWMRPPLVAAVPGVDQSVGAVGASLAAGGLKLGEPAGPLLPTGQPPGSGASAAGISGLAVPPAQSTARSARSMSTGGAGSPLPRTSSVGAGSSRLKPDSGTAPSRIGVARVGPVGGVIGGVGAHTGVGPMPIGSTGRSSGAAANPHEAPATLRWEVAQGCAPVIEPEPEIPVRLEPGVIGVDYA